MSSEPAAAIDPALIEPWLRARSVARGLPQPVRDRGGLRLDTNLPVELRRYVFARPGPGLIELGRSITAPLVFLKLCGPPEQLAALLPAHWRLSPVGYVMTCGTPPATVGLSPGYRMEIHANGPVTEVCILDDRDALAASGFAAEWDGLFIYDRIVTDAGHRRKGLGRAVMAALGAARRSPQSRQLLVATEEGRALYAMMGWDVGLLFSSAGIADDTGV
ncbi:GNAT family N-acetyltransferase [Sphingomonas sp. So64.6b]|uniref:GNAT family N-acetyltransferase n=1 Tax=Sphingomonas sp. So64.6b TaxID=2997354 RepID=UPI001603F6DF|nr:GNAT family N-acetyltransferase [Sphingomonas sp. So64.6b]QNA85988.1 GNAT family N-acetyltransferase [Sphingomonas sp. So64.6b]